MIPCKTHLLPQKILELAGFGGFMEHSWRGGALGVSQVRPPQLSGHWHVFGARQMPLFWQGGRQIAEDGQTLKI